MSATCLHRPPPEPALDVNARLVQCFVTLAEELHFGRAAEALYVGQPAFSRSIQQLERRLGRRLFTRSTRTVALTPAGAALLPAGARAARVAARRHRRTRGGARDAARRARPRLGHPRHPARPLRPPAPAAHGLRSHADPERAARGASERGNSTSPSAPRTNPGSPCGRCAWTRCWWPSSDATRTCGAPSTCADESSPCPRIAISRQFSRSTSRRSASARRRVAVASGSGTEAYALRRAGARAFLWLASRRTALDATLVGALPLQAYVQWNLVHRRPATPAVRAFLDVAEEVSAAEGWLRTDSLAGEPWLAGGQHVHKRHRRLRPRPARAGTVPRGHRPRRRRSRRPRARRARAHARARSAATRARRRRAARRSPGAPADA